MKRRKSKITLEQKNEADIQIREMQKEIKYDLLLMFRTYGRRHLKWYSIFQF